MTQSHKARTGTQEVWFQASGCPWEPGRKQQAHFIMFYTVMETHWLTDSHGPRPPLHLLWYHFHSISQCVQSRGKGKGRQRNGGVDPTTPITLMDVSSTSRLSSFWSHTVLCFLSSILDLPVFTSFSHHLMFFCFVYFTQEVYHWLSIISFSV